MSEEFHQYTKEMFKRRRAGARVMPFKEWKDTMVERMELIAFIEAEMAELNGIVDNKNRMHYTAFLD